jgi:hypothetical protein
MCSEAEIKSWRLATDFYGLASLLIGDYLIFGLNAHKAKLPPLISCYVPIKKLDSLPVRQKQMKFIEIVNDNSWICGLIDLK